MAVNALLNTAWEAITSNQIAMNVTGANIANVNTPGYTRQRVEFNAVGSIDLTGQGSMGISVDSVDRLYNRYLETQIVDQSQIAGFNEARLEILGRVEGVFNETAGNGLSDAINQFWNSWEALASDPTNQIVRYSVVSAATNLTSLFRESSNVLSAVQQGTQDDMEATVTDINSLTSEIASLNYQILGLGAEDGSANNLLDRRMEFIKDLADKINISYYENSDGALNVFLANGNSIVSGDSSRQLSVNEGVVTYKSDATNESLNSVITGGRLGAMIETAGMTDSTVADYLDSLNQLADGIVNIVNDLHTNGWAAETKISDVIPGEDNQYTGVVSSGGDFTNLLNNKTYVMEILMTGAFGTATYQITDDGGKTWVGSTTVSGEGIIDLGDGVNLTFDATQLLYDGDTFTVNAGRDGIEPVFGIDNYYDGEVVSSGAYTGNVNKTYAMKIINGDTFVSGFATYQISNDGGLNWGTVATIPGGSSGDIILGDGIMLSFSDDFSAARALTETLVAGDIFYVNAYPYGTDVAFFDNTLAGARNMQVSETILDNPEKIVNSYDPYRAERIRVESWLSTTESSLIEVSGLLQQAQEVAQNGDAASVRSVTIDGIIADILAIANNTQLDGRYIFSGTATHVIIPFGPPVPLGTTYTYNGNSTPLSINIGEYTDFSIPGTPVFFDALKALTDLKVVLDAAPASTDSVDIDDLVAADQQVQDNITTTRIISSNLENASFGETARQIGAARNALAMDDGTATFNDFYAALVGQVGYDVKAADAGVTRNAAVTNQLLSLRDSVSGVSMDEEIINLMKYQFGYNTAARLVKSANDMLDVLMALGQ